VQRGAKSRMRRTEIPEPILIKFCLVVDITDIVTQTNFGDHRLGVFGSGGSNFPLFSLIFIVVLTTLSHYRASIAACDGAKCDSATVVLTRCFKLLSFFYNNRI